MANQQESESNDDLSTADTVTFGDSLHGRLFSFDDIDYYKITATNSGSVTIDFDSPANSLYGTYFQLGLYDSAGNLKSYKDVGDDTTVTYSSLSAGDYYFKVSSSTYFSSDQYSFITTFTDSESEVNDAVGVANTTVFGRPLTGLLSDSSDLDFYQIQVTESGTLSIDFNSPTDSDYGTYFQLALYDDSGSLHSYKEIGKDSTLSFSGLSVGDYFYSVSPSAYFSGEQYSLTPTFIVFSENEYESEDNNDPGTADIVQLGSLFKGRLFSSGDIDYYKIFAKDSGSLTVNFDSPVNSSYGTYFQLALYDSSGNLHSYKDVGKDTIVTYGGLSAGNYYYKVSSSTYLSDDQYSFTPTFEASSSKDYESESNDTLSAADAVSLGASFRGSLSSPEDLDFFQIKVREPGTLEVAFDAPTNSTYSNYFQLSLYDATGALRSHEDTGQDITVSYSGLSAGDYYYRVSSSTYSSDEEYNFSPTFTVSLANDYESEDNSDLGAADIVPLGSPFKGRLSSSDDIDYYKITAPGSGSLSINFDSPVKSSYGTYFQLSLYDSNGDLYSSKDVGKNTTVTYEGLSPGAHYYKVASSTYSSDDQYSLTPTFEVSSIENYESESNDSLPTADVVPLGTQFRGRLSTVTDIDYYQISATTAGALSIAFDSPMSSSYSDYFQLSLFDVNGNLQGEKGVSADTEISYSGLSAGDYYFKVASKGFFTSDQYNFTVNLNVEDTISDDINTLATLSSGSPVSGLIDSKGDKDWFAIDLAANRSYKFSLEGGQNDKGTLFDPVIAGVYNSSGSLIPGTTNDDGGYGKNSELELDVLVAGRHYISAGGVGSGTGSYELSMVALKEKDDFGASVLNAGLIELVIPVVGEIERQSDKDWFGIALESDTSYRISLEGSPTMAGTLSDPVIVGVYNSSGVLVPRTTDDDSGIGKNSELGIDVAITGQYYISAGGANSTIGSYKLSIVKVAETDDFSGNPDSPGSIRVGSFNIGKIEKPYDRDWFAVNLERGRSYEVILEGKDSGAGSLGDPYFDGVYDSTGLLLASTQDDDGGVGSNSFATFTTKNPGTYYMSAAGHLASTGTYKVSINERVIPDDYQADRFTLGRVDVESSATGVIEAPYDRDWFAVKLTTGKDYVIDLKGAPTSSGTLAATYIAGLYDPSGRLIADTSDFNSGVGDNSSIKYTAPSSGTYYLSAAGKSDRLGSYTVSVAESIPVPSKIQFDIVIQYTGDPQFKKYFDAAELRWEEIIVGDLPSKYSRTHGLIDDLLITAAAVTMDQGGKDGFNKLGHAAPREWRSGSLLPSVSMMEFDEWDMAYMEQKGILQSVILHEMGHALGFGVFWDYLGLKVDFDYIGPNAVKAYQEVMDNGLLIFIPIEQSTGRAGSDGGHWAENVLDRELMTPSIETYRPNPLSIITVGAMKDLGYVVNTKKADFFGGNSSVISSASSLRQGSFSDQSSVFSSLSDQSFNGSVFSFNNSKPLVLNAASTVEKLSGFSPTASESQITFFETSTGYDFYVTLEGSFAENEPSSPSEVKGTVTRITFFEEGQGFPTSLTFNSPRDVKDVLADWYGNFLLENNKINVVTFSATDDYVDAGPGDDIIDLGGGNDTLIGSEGKDTFYAGLGDDLIDGGSGLDTVIFSENYDQYTVEAGADSVLNVASVVEGSDSITSVERLRFKDKNIAFDLDGNAGSVSKILGAFLGPSGVQSPTNVGLGIQLLDDGMSYKELMQAAITIVFGAAPAGGNVVETFYKNLTGQSAPADLIEVYGNSIDSGEISVLDFSLQVAETEINIQNIDLIGLSSVGLEYV